jgi:hypothetical protein
MIREMTAHPARAPRNPSRREPPPGSTLDAMPQMPMARGKMSKTYPSSRSVRALRKRPKAAARAGNRAGESPHRQASRPPVAAPHTSAATYRTAILLPQ